MVNVFGSAVDYFFTDLYQAIISKSKTQNFGVRTESHKGNNDRDNGTVAKKDFNYALYTTQPWKRLIK